MTYPNIQEKEWLHSIINFIVDNQADRVCLGNDITSDVLRKIGEFPVNGESFEDLYREICENIIPYCSDFHNVSFMGFPDSGNSIAGIFGAVCADLLQQNLINATFCSPIGTRIEIAIIKWLRSVLGYKVFKKDSVESVGGIVTIGGTLSNTIAKKRQEE